jgi:hypothetical protein
MNHVAGFWFSTAHLAKSIVVTKNAAMEVFCAHAIVAVTDRRDHPIAAILPRR